jgi:hypothetical protein
MSFKLLAALCVLGLLPFSSLADPSNEEIPITVDNFVRAASDFELGKYESLAGGVNRFLHFREPTPIAQQSTIRMNRDTLYSAAVVDISNGATVTLPDAGDRYMTLMVVNQDHFINDVFSGGGSYTLDQSKYETPYVLVWARFLVDATDAEDVAVVNELQDRMVIEAGSAKPFVMPSYDEDQYRAMIAAILNFGPFIPDSSRMFGSKKEVDPVRHLIGTAAGYGGLPEREAYYVNVDPNLPVAEYVINVPANVPVSAFWSISLYNAQGFFEPNEHEAYSINSVSGARNDDGSMAVHLGGCEDGRANCLPIMEGWNYTVRLYQPGPEIIDGSWVFPAAQLMK